MFRSFVARSKRKSADALMSLSEIVAGRLNSFLILAGSKASEITLEGPDGAANITNFGGVTESRPRPREDKGCDDDQAKRTKATEYSRPPWSATNAPRRSLSTSSR